jgi:hypothetical protein
MVHKIIQQSKHRNGPDYNGLRIRLCALCARIQLASHWIELIIYNL